MSEGDAEHGELIDAATLPGVPDEFQRLWTPHRMAYITAGADVNRGSGCPFCAAPQRTDAEGLIVHRGQTAYVLLNLSHIVLRFREPELPRGYRTPGGVLTTGIAMVLAIVAVVATFLVDVLAASITAGVFLVFLAYFWFYSRHHLVANAPEEEFALVEGAETDLE